MRPFIAGDDIPSNDSFWRGLLRRVRSRAVVPRYPLRARAANGRTLLAIDEPLTADVLLTGRAGAAYSGVEAIFDAGTHRFVAMPGGRTFTGNVYEYNRATDIPIGTAVEAHYTAADDWRFVDVAPCCGGPSSGACTLPNAPAPGTIRWGDPTSLGGGTHTLCDTWTYNEAVLCPSEVTTITNSGTCPYNIDWGYTLRLYPTLAAYQSAFPEYGSSQFRICPVPTFPALLSEPFVIQGATIARHYPAGGSLSCYGPGGYDSSVTTRIAAVVTVQCDHPLLHDKLSVAYCAEYQQLVGGAWQSALGGASRAFPLLATGPGATLGADSPDGALLGAGATTTSPVTIRFTPP